MMRLRTIIVALLAVSLQFSACMAGLFSVPQAEAAERSTIALSSVSLRQSLPMSLLSQDTLSCHVQQDQDDTDGIRTAAKGCSDARLCLGRQQRSGTERSLVFRQPEKVIVSLFRPLLVSPDDIRSSTDALRLARDGPLFAQAPQIARTLRKRE